MTHPSGDTLSARNAERFAAKVREELANAPTGPNGGCEHYPCHFKGQDCSFCFCPFYPCLDEDLGRFVTSSRTGEEVWSCKECMWIHRPEVVRTLMGRIRELGITEPDDCRLKVLKGEVERAIPKKGRAIMVLGATSGAGKSLIAAALCRILSNMGMRVSPFKAQNMSLNSFVTAEGEEVARAQALQALAARAEVGHHMNPILLKPKRDDVSQVVVEGRPHRDCDVRSYYEDFVPKEGVEIVRRNIDHLLQLNDVVVMEGAGSPAEINIYHRDIANMGAARLADADCLLVVNIEWGGAFAYALGTLDLLPREDRERVKGILINNMRGNPEGLRPGMDLLEEMTGVPVLGVVPHMDLRLPTEDSMFITDGVEGGVRVGVIRLPRISNFTDMDALALEGASVAFIDTAEEVTGVDAIVVPGTKNTVQDLLWMRERGMDAAIVSRAGDVPILGICGGYQMLGRRIVDAQGLEGGEGAEVEGLGLLDMTTTFDIYDKRTVQVEGELLPSGGRVRGYEIHMGSTDRGEVEPLFRVRDAGGEHLEGGRDEGRMVFGTYLHGAFDLPAFRRHFLDLVRPMERAGEGRDQASVVEEDLERLAATVADAMDMDRFLPRFGLEGGT